MIFATFFYGLTEFPYFKSPNFSTCHIINIIDGRLAKNKNALNSENRQNKNAWLFQIIVLFYFWLSKKKKKITKSVKFFLRFLCSLSHYACIGFSVTTPPKRIWREVEGKPFHVKTLEKKIILFHAYEMCKWS